MAARRRSRVEGRSDPCGPRRKPPPSPASPVVARGRPRRTNPRRRASRRVGTLGVRRPAHGFPGRGRVVPHRPGHGCREWLSLKLPLRSAVVHISPGRTRLTGAEDVCSARGQRGLTRRMMPHKDRRQRTGRAIPVQRSRCHGFVTTPDGTGSLQGLGSGRPIVFHHGWRQFRRLGYPADVLRAQRFSRHRA